MTTLFTKGTFEHRAGYRGKIMYKYTGKKKKRTSISTDAATSPDTLGISDRQQGRLVSQSHQ